MPILALTAFSAAPVVAERVGYASRAGFLRAFKGVLGASPTGDMLKLGWAGQSNLDFMCRLLFSALWVAWRHRFSPAGVTFALLAAVAGTPILCDYLLIEGTRSGGDVRGLLLGTRLHDR